MPNLFALITTNSYTSKCIESIILPNLLLRECDEELFEDNPSEYIRRDAEGSDSDSRRKCACDLLSSLTKSFQTEVSQIALGYVEKMLTQYSTSPAQHWRNKDAAVALVIAVAVHCEVLKIV